VLAVDPQHELGAMAMTPASACSHGSSARKSRLKDKPVMSGARKSMERRPKTRAHNACVASALPIASTLFKGRAAKSSHPRL